MARYSHHLKIPEVGEEGQLELLKSKVLLNIGDPLSGRLMVYEALGLTFRQFKVRRDPNCQTCGENANIDLESIPDFVCPTGQ